MINTREMQIWLHNHNYYHGPIDGQDNPAVQVAIAWVAQDRMANSNIDTANWSIEKNRLCAEQMFLRAKGYQDIVVNGEPSSETTAAHADYSAKITAAPQLPST